MILWTLRVTLFEKMTNLDKWVKSPHYNLVIIDNKPYVNLLIKLNND